MNPYTGKTIFVQIASYRDSQLIPTLDDLFDKADEPDNLRVCICWQHSEDDEWDNLDKYQNDKRVKIIDIKADESKGVCWARNLIQQEYLFEDFTLQLDSHHRFVEGWDTELKNEILQLQLQGYEKPLLTSYITSFHPSLPEDEWAKEPWWMTFDRFTPDGVIFFTPSTIPDWQTRKTPVPARFYSAHFCFTLGSFCEEVQHDPRYYFHGEEIAIAVRAYTHGYDLFHPHKIVAYHEFSRDYRPDKHWDTYNKWGEHNQQTFTLMRNLLGIDGYTCTDEEKFGKYGLGKERTVADWETYAGIRFADRYVQQDTVNNKLPPNDPESRWYNRYKHCIDLGLDAIDKGDYDFWVIALHDKAGETVYRQDANETEIDKLMNDPDGYIKLWVEAEVTGVPYEYVVWPHCKNNGWLSRITGLI